MFCRNCGKEILNEAVVCPHCGCLTGVQQQPQAGQYGSPYVDQNGNPYVYQNGSTFVDQNGNPVNMTYDRYGNPNNPYLDRYGPQKNPFENQTQSNVPDEVNAGLVVLSVLFPVIGIILGAVNQNNGRKKSAKAYILAAVISWIAWIFIIILIAFLSAFFG